jgi:hypothetical protein
MNISSASSIAAAKKTAIFLVRGRQIYPDGWRARKKRRNHEILMPPELVSEIVECKAC